MVNDLDPSVELKVTVFASLSIVGFLPSFKQINKIGR